MMACSEVSRLCRLQHPLYRAGNNFTETFQLQNTKAFYFASLREFAKTMVFGLMTRYKDLLLCLL